MLHTPICDYFGIKYPILLDGMSGVTSQRLVASAHPTYPKQIAGLCDFVSRPTGLRDRD
jgi:hypothetical protein